MVKLMDTVADLAEELEIPGEALPGGCRITLTSRRRAVVEYHAGLRGYSSPKISSASRTVSSWLLSSSRKSTRNPE